MKKIIIFICICLCLCLGFRNVDASGLFDITVTQNVEGIVGGSLNSPEVKFTVNSDVYIFNQDKEGEDVTSWFTNIPDGCNYSAEIDRISVTGNECIVKFSGDIKKTVEALERDIAATIVSTEEDDFLINSMNDVYYDGSTDCINGGAKYIITELFDIQYDGPYTVSGYVGEELTPQIVKVEITSDTDKFKVEEIVNKVLSTVNGLTATVTECPDNKHITITYTGTPVATSQELIHTTVCKDYMTWGSKDRIVPDREDVKFNIIDRTPPSPPEIEDDDPIPYIPPVTGVN